MKRILSALALVAFSVVACGDDDDDDDTNGDNGGTAGTGATSSDAGEPPVSSGGSDGTGATGGAPPTMNVECDETADGVCQNENDCPFVESGEARMTAGSCGLGCLLDGNTEEACPRECLLEAIDISEGCGQCYVDAAMCGIENCAVPCMAPESTECQMCLVEEGCREAFNTCSGLQE